MTDLDAELGAIDVIGRTLGNIPDPEVRARVLRWSVERFGATRPGGAVVPAVAKTADPALAVDALGEFFAPHSERGDPADLDVPDVAQPVSSLVHSFVTDFRRLVVEWQGT
jgi:hypothetical protein